MFDRPLSLLIDRISPVMTAAALCMSGSATLSVAHAQSGYTATTLNSPYLASLDVPRRLDIDNNNRVHGNRAVFSLGQYLAQWVLGSRNGYLPRPSTWAPSTGTSVSPVNLPSLPHTQFESMTASDSGAWTLLMDTRNVPTPKLYGNGKLQDVSAGAGLRLSAMAVNNSGTVGGYVYEDATRTTWPVVWQNGMATRLPTGSYPHGKVTAINNLGVAVGQVYDDNNGSAAARWVNGSLELPAQALGYSRSTALKINDKGAMVLSLGQSDVAQPLTTAVLQDGSLTTLAAESNIGAITDINNAGVVVGYSGDERGRLWKNGVAYDLTALAKSMGAQLPATAVINRVFSINDSGSMAVDYHLSDKVGGRTVVRLTARP